jgi:arylsulfatase
MSDSSRPNILVMISDQQRGDHLGCMGNDILQTPNLDRLAQSGVLCRRHYVNNPICMPSRATLFNGQTSRGHGVRTSGIALSDQYATLPQILWDAGYQTHLIGKLHLDPYGGREDVFKEPENHLKLKAGEAVRGFQTGELSLAHGKGVLGAYHDWLLEKLDGRENPWDQQIEGVGNGAEGCFYSEITPGLHHSMWIADRTEAFFHERDKEKPFFLWCSYPDPHHPYTPPMELVNRYPWQEMPLPARRDGEHEDLPPHMQAALDGGTFFTGRSVRSTNLPDDQIREIIALTYGMVDLIDRSVGQILKSLDEHDLDKDTLVIFTSDHGEMLGDHRLLNKGPFHFEGLLKVPFIVRLPGRTKAGTVCDGVTSHLDFLPTVLDAVGLDYPHEAPISPYYTQEHRPSLPGKNLWPVLQGDANKVQDSVIAEFDEDYLAMTLKTIITERYKLNAYAGQEYGELYDLQEDPKELYNRWSDPEFSELKARLRLDLLDLLMRTESSLPRMSSHA